MLFIVVLFPAFYSRPVVAEKSKSLAATGSSCGDELTKRSSVPLPIELDGEIVPGRSRPLSYYDFPNEQDTPLRPMTHPADYLGLVNRAIESARKESPGSEEYVTDGSVKWLTRALAFMMRDTDIIHAIQRRYAIKVADERIAPSQRNRANEKMDQWTSLLTTPRRLEIEELVDNVAQSYGDDVDYFKAHLLGQQRMRTSAEQVAAMTLQLRHTEEAFRAWHSSELNISSACQMINKELQLYVEEMEKGDYLEDALIRTSMTDHAIKAIAWLRKARQLQARERQS